jgi:NitT/TauT family transport system substrate-binding protein
VKTRRAGFDARARLRLAFALALALVAPGDLLRGAGEPDAARTPDRIKLAAPPYFSSAPMFVAADLGFYAAEGIDVEFVTIARSTGALPALAQGQVDAIGTIANAALFNLIARGAPIKIVAARAYEASGGCVANAVVARKGLIEQGRLAGAESMRGLRLSMDPAGTPTFFVSVLLDRLGLSLDDFELSDVTAAARGEALARDLIDLAVVFEPEVTQILDSGAAEIWIPGHHIAPDFQFTFLLFGERLLERERDLGTRLVRAYLRGVERYIDEGKSPRLVEALAHRTHLDEDLIRRMCWPPTVRDGRIDTGSLERYQSWAMKRGLIDATIDVAKMIDTGFVEAANER